jgi:glucuronoarabinoxylan endo-1,4-beta-xylanase
VSFSLQHLGLAGGPAIVTPVVTDATSDAAPQAPTFTRSGSFTSTLPARSLVTFVVTR